MGTRRTENGDNWPPDGDRSPDEQPDLPERPALPPEWGEIIIPDDPAELAAEAEQIRWELAQEKIDRPWWERFRMRGLPETEPAVGVPLLIMSVAVLLTLISLCAMAWSGSSVPERPQPHPSPMPPVTLTDSGGHAVTLATLAPAVILLVEECDCATLTAETVAAAPPGVTVIAVDSSTPPPEAAAGNPLVLTDPEGAVRAALGLSPPTGAAATVVLVNQDQEVTYSARVASVAAFRSALADLASQP